MAGHLLMLFRHQAALFRGLRSLPMRPKGIGRRLNYGDIRRQNIAAIGERQNVVLAGVALAELAAKIADPPRQVVNDYRRSAPDSSQESFRIHRFARRLREHDQSIDLFGGQLYPRIASFERAGLGVEKEWAER